jgi:hypothetical protein
MEEHTALDTQHTDLMGSHAPAPGDVDQRLARLEQLLTAQQQHIARLEAAQTSAPRAAMPLPVPLPVAPEHDAGDEAAPDAVEPPARQGRRSRRALLKLGGAAAAAGVAAAAAAATELAHPGTAQAADGSSMILGHTNASTAGTLLQNSTGTTSTVGALEVLDTGDGATFGYTWGLLSRSTNGLGVLGVSGGITESISTLVQTQAGVYGFSAGSAPAVVAQVGTTPAATPPSVSPVALAAYNTTGSGYAVFGRSAVNGILGQADAGIGVHGATYSGSGVLGFSTGGYGGDFSGGSAPLHLSPNGNAGAPASGTHAAGELYVDSLGILWYCIASGTAGTGTWVQVSGVPAGAGAGVPSGSYAAGQLFVDGNHALWYCTASGTPGTWAQLTGIPAPVPSGLLHYLSAPIRIFDSRLGTSAPLPAPTKGALTGGSTTTIQVTGTDVGGIHVPAGATGVFGNLTVTNTQGGGDLILWPHGAPQPLTSNINYGPGQTVANSVSVGLSTAAPVGGKMDLYVHVSGTDVILDVAGYVL